jgi:protein-L-isoaspartate(D-aspartate) O-methyltransferase
VYHAAFRRGNARTLVGSRDLRRLAAADMPSDAGSAGADWVRSGQSQARDESAMTDNTQQRINMVDSQVRPSDVTDRRIIKAMLEVPREAFAPAEMRALAYMDRALPVTKPDAAGLARTLLAPRTLAKMLQLATVEPGCTVLDVGCGTGYSTALLGRLAGKVVALEADPDLAEWARATLRKLDVAGVEVVQGPLAAGVPDEAPFDAILLNGAVPEVPQALLDQLKDGGRLVAIVAPGGYGRAQVWRRTGRSFGNVTAFDAAADPLPGFAREPGFVF